MISRRNLTTWVVGAAVLLGAGLWDSQAHALNATAKERRFWERSAKLKGKAFEKHHLYSREDYDKALKYRPDNVKKLLPHSKALIISGKYVDIGALKKGNAIIMAANGRNHWAILGALFAAQAANAPLIVEIARSEGGRKAYCKTGYWTLASKVANLADEVGITIPIVIHADHFGIKSMKELPEAEREIKSIIKAGMTSIAIDASHMSTAENIFANLQLLRRDRNGKRILIPDAVSVETEIGEIAGKLGLSTAEEAVAHMAALNAHGQFPLWIALNNGTAHGVQTSEHGIQVDRTQEIHEAIAKFLVSGAQHGTSGNDSERLRQLAKLTDTTKANVATALQMISWGVSVNAFGNAAMDDLGRLIKMPNQGVTMKKWALMMRTARDHKPKPLSAGNPKQLNALMEDELLTQSPQVQSRMWTAVARFANTMMTRDFNAGNVAPLVIEAILQKESADPGDRAGRFESPDKWSDKHIIEVGAALDEQRQELVGNFED